MSNKAVTGIRLPSHSTIIHNFPCLPEFPFLRKSYLGRQAIIELVLRKLRIKRGNDLKAKAENLWKTYEAINELIRFADTKATVILAVNGVIAGFYFSNIGTLQTILQQKPIALVQSQAPPWDLKP